jgi:hypothetical protein
MKVRELIAQLSEVNQDSEVYLYINGERIGVQSVDDNFSDDWYVDINAAEHKGETMKVSELSGAALDGLVAKCEEFEVPSDWLLPEYNPSTNWELGGTIIARERISLLDQGGDCWLAICGWKEVFGDTQLIAAMRSYVASKLGDEVQLPGEV